MDHIQATDTIVDNKQKKLFDLEAARTAYADELIPGTNLTVKIAAYSLCRDELWMKKAFMTRTITKAMEARVPKHIHDQCIGLKVPYNLFKLGALFYNETQVKYWGIYAVSILLDQVEKRKLPTIHGVRIRFSVPNLKRLLDNQDAYLEAVDKGQQANYSTMCLLNVLEAEDTGNKYKVILYPRGEIIITGALVFYHKGNNVDEQEPIYFAMDWSKTRVKNADGTPTPYGQYQTAMVKTKAMRHALQEVYGTLMPEVSTVDEAIAGPIEDESMSWDIDYSEFDRLKQERLLRVMGPQQPQEEGPRVEEV